MEAHFYRTLWGAGSDYDAVAAEARAAGFMGLEGPLPAGRTDMERLRAALVIHDLRYIGEISTGGASSAYWVPRRDADVAEHLRTLDAEMARYEESELEMDFINCM